MNLDSVILSPSQQAVIDAFPGFLLSDDTEMTISGPAGTGKTFLVQCLTHLAPAHQKMVQLLDPEIPNRQFVYTATTNKAAEVLRETVGKEVTTIHSTLSLRVQNDYATGKQLLVPGRKAERLSNSVIFIDEASMINDELAKAIRGTINKWKDCKMVFIGDKYQLPPVKEDICSIFQPGAPNVFELLEIQRQAADSPIISLATNYRTLLDEPSPNWPVIEPDDESIFYYDDKKAYFKAIKEAYKEDHEANDLKIVAWTNNRVMDYNEWIRNRVLGLGYEYHIGEYLTSNKPLFSGNVILAPTDYVVQVKDLDYTVNTSYDEEVYGWNIQLEDIGTVFQPQDRDQVRRISKRFAADKDWGPYFAIKEQWADLRPIHASTVHKAQGSTYKKVFVDLEDIGKNTRWRDLVRLIYVAVTRASHEVHIFGNIGVSHKVRPAEETMEAFKNVHGLLRHG